jgi:TRAP-type C4-dicarboxylate transport system substrate-binding protein
VVFQRKAWEDSEAAALKTIADAGVLVTRVADKAAWKAAAQSVLDSNSGPYADTLSAIASARPALQR